MVSNDYFTQLIIQNSIMDKQTRIMEKQLRLQKIQNTQKALKSFQYMMDYGKAPPWDTDTKLINSRTSCPVA